MSKQKIGTAPYNFVPLPERIVTRYPSVEHLPTHDASNPQDRNLLSGEITFNIIAQNPIIVAEGQNENEKRKFIKDAKGKYEIPGSTIRGLIRNTVSVLSLSDWTKRIDEERFFYRSVADQSTTLGNHYKNVLGVKSKLINNKCESIPENVQAGYIVKTAKDEYCIYHARTDGGRLGKTYYKVNDGNLAIKKDHFRRNVKKGFIVEEVTFSLNNKGKVVKLFQQDARFKGHLLYSGFIKTGKTNKVSAYLINEIDQEKQPISLNKKDVQAYKADLNFRLSKFKKSERPRMQEFFELPEKIGIEHGKPCFFLQYDGVTYFGFTAFIRLLFPYSTKDLLPEYITNQKNGIDYADALFGFTSENGRSKYASRVHFHSAKINSPTEQVETARITPGSPRASAYRFYLDQDTSKTGNDYYTYLTKETTIRGMKQYWIKDVERLNSDNKSNSLATEIEALPKHTVFKAKITFDQLHEDELGLLLWALQGPSFHQIGMGKPYGYGVVSFELIKCYVTNYQDLYNDLTNMFHVKKVRINIESYIEKYKNFMIQLLNQQGFKTDANFKLEELDSINIFLAMKEFAKLKREEMQYTDKSLYSKVTLPTAKQLLNREDSLTHPSRSNKSSITSNNDKKKELKNQQKKEAHHRRAAHTPFADLLKDFKFNE